MGSRQAGSLRRPATSRKTSASRSKPTLTSSSTVGECLVGRHASGAAAFETPLSFCCSLASPIVASPQCYFY
eukprot:scaffold6249_cov124-Isochrysis_galbana.AAC.4